MSTDSNLLMFSYSVVILKQVFNFSMNVSNMCLIHSESQNYHFISSKPFVYTIFSVVIYTPPMGSISKPNRTCSVCKHFHCDLSLLFTSTLAKAHTCKHPPFTTLFLFWKRYTTHRLLPVSSPTSYSVSPCNPTTTTSINASFGGVRRFGCDVKCRKWKAAVHPSTFAARQTSEIISNVFMLYI